MKLIDLRLCILASWLAACAPMKQPETSPRVNDLAARLSSVRWPDMATGLAMDPQVTAIWSEFPEAGLYAALVEDPQRALPVRFAAALVLRSKNAEQLKHTDPTAVAQVFAAALQHDLAGYAYPWGWLWAPGDTLGFLGPVFIDIGRPAIGPLSALLDDTTTRDTYLGSEEATEMAMRCYRVKDFAAFYLAKSLHLDLPWEPDLARRDRAIARLRTQLPADPPAK